MEPSTPMTDREMASHYFGVFVDLLDAIVTALESPDDELRAAVEAVQRRVSFTFTEEE